MNLKKFAVRGLVITAVVVALCMFFSGTIKTITTAKIKTTQAKSGRLEEKTSLSGKLVFPEVDPIGFDLEQGQTLQITKVNARVGYDVKAGDVVVEARVADYENTMKGYQQSYDDALDQLLSLESKNGSIRIRRSDEMYAEAYFNLRDAQKALMAAKIAMESLLSSEKLPLPESGMPEGASDALIAAIENYNACAEARETAQTAMDSVARYLPDDATWSYMTSKHDCEEKMAEAERKMQSLSLLNGSVQAIVATHDGYVAEMLVKEGDMYDGSSDLFSISSEGTMPILRVDISNVEKTISEGMTVNMSSDRYGTMETRVLETGLDTEGKRYADVEVTYDMVRARGSVYSMTIEETPLTLINRSKQQTTLISASAIHGTGDDRYVYTVETSYSNFGNSKMTVRKMNVTVLAEASGLVSIEEDLSYYTLAYMEDRPINDGDMVMLYGD